jgi:hypothetical protein
MNGAAFLRLTCKAAATIAAFWAIGALVITLGALAH